MAGSFQPLYFRWQRAGAITFIVLACGLGTAAAAAPKAAHPGGGITISPPLKQLTLGPGLLQAHTSVTVINNSSQPVSGAIQAVDIVAQGQSGGFNLLPAGRYAPGTGLARWMKIDGDGKLALAPGQQTDLQVTITNDSSLGPGGHYAAVVVGVGSGNTPSGRQIAFNQQLVSLLFVKKTGAEKPGLALQAIDYAHGLSLPKTLTLTFRSTGNVFVTPRGFAELTDPAGKLVAKGIINPQSSLIIQGASRQFTVPLQTVSASQPRGRYALRVYYRYEGSTVYQSQTVYIAHGIALKTIIIAGFGALVIVAAVLLYAYRAARASR